MKVVIRSPALPLLVLGIILDVPVSKRRAAAIRRDRATVAKKILPALAAVWRRAKV